MRRPGRGRLRTGLHRHRVRRTRRTELVKALLAARRSGDLLLVTKLDRRSRSLEHLIDLSGALQERGVDLVVLDQGIDTSTAWARGVGVMATHGVAHGHRTFGRSSSAE